MLTLAGFGAIVGGACLVACLAGLGAGVAWGGGQFREVISRQRDLIDEQRKAILAQEERAGLLRKEIDYWKTEVQSH